MFKETTIIITGGSSGVGKELALRLSRLGANLAIIARDEKKLKTVKKELSGICSDQQKSKFFPAMYLTTTRLKKPLKKLPTASVLCTS